jgi:uncharacterized protein YdhG (YjbR/CyaY superfamily)
MNAAFLTIDEYIASFPPDVQAILQKIREVIREEVPEATEAIKYAIPTFIYHGNLVHFAAFRKHIGFYPTPSAVESFKEALAPYKQGRGSVQFPLSDPMPFELIRRIVRDRVRTVTKG